MKPEAINAEDDASIYDINELVLTEEGYNYRHSTSVRGAIQHIKAVASTRRESLQSGDNERIESVRQAGRVLIVLDGKFFNHPEGDLPAVTPESDPELFTDEVVARHFKVETTHKEITLDDGTSKTVTSHDVVPHTEFGENFFTALLVARVAVRELGAENVGLLFTTGTKLRNRESPADFLTQSEMGTIPVEIQPKPFNLDEFVAAAARIVRSEVTYTLPGSDANATPTE